MHHSTTTTIRRFFLFHHHGLFFVVLFLSSTTTVWSKRIGQRQQLYPPAPSPPSRNNNHDNDNDDNQQQRQRQQQQQQRHISSSCEDANIHCDYWAGIGECDKNPGYMLVFCQESCDVCQEDTESPTGSPTGSPTESPMETGHPLLEEFYQAHGGRDQFPEQYQTALATLILGQLDLDRGDVAAAQEQLQTLKTEFQWLTPSDWDSSRLAAPPAGDYNAGHIFAYHGLRMLDQILTTTTSTTSTSSSLQLTAVIAPCATVSRPTDPNAENLAPETLQLDLAPELRANDYAILHQASSLFRHWLRALTNRKIDLVLYELSSCTTVDFWVEPNVFGDGQEVIYTYADFQTMADALPDDVKQATDLFWGIAPSGCPGDGAAFFDKYHIVTGGQGDYQGQMYFLSDDLWFTRKMVQLGKGPYTEVERRAYHSQWFQHEFMHYMFSQFDQYDLEVTLHQWFDRSTWPSDFVGNGEADYYWNTFEKRITSTCSMVNVLSNPITTKVAEIMGGIPALVGRYRRWPVQNNWHEMELTLDGNGGLVWTNQAGVSWNLIVENDQLYSSPDSPYGKQEIKFDVDIGGVVSAVYLEGNQYSVVGYQDPCLSSSAIKVITDEFSEEDEASGECPKVNGLQTIMIGLSCDGDNCDNLRMTCYNNGSLEVKDRVRKSPWFSEERGGKGQCPRANEVITKMDCKGGYCDDLQLSCQELASISVDYNDCDETPRFPSPPGNKYGYEEIPLDMYPVGIQCFGGWCGYKTIRYCAECQDHNQHCESWAGSGECDNNPGYMLIYCKKACDYCGEP